MSGWKGWKKGAKPTKASKFVEKLKADTTGCRLRAAKFGVRKALPKEQCQQAADTFGATPEYLRASKRLLNTKNPAFREVTRVIAQARSYWRSVTFPYPEPGVRLIKKDRMQAFDEQMKAFVEKLETARETLSEQWELLKGEAREKLGDLYQEWDYPADIEVSFDLGWEFPNLAAPEFLKSMNPVMYEAEQAKIEAQLNQAVKLTEMALAEELDTLVTHLLDRLTPGDDGQAKTFKKAAIANFDEFFAKFEDMDLCESDTLRDLVVQAKSALGGVDVNAIRKDDELRAALSGKIQAVKTAMDAQVIAKPKRAIVLEDEPKGGAV